MLDTDDNEDIHDHEDNHDPKQNHDHNQEQESALPTTFSSREWEKPRKSVEFSPSSTKRVSSVQQPTISEAERTLEGNGPSVEFPNKGQGIVFPSSELLPVNYPEEDVGKQKEIHPDLCCFEGRRN